MAKTRGKPCAEVSQRNGVRIRKKAPPERYRVVVVRPFGWHTLIRYLDDANVIVSSEPQAAFVRNQSLEFTFARMDSVFSAAYVEANVGVELLRQDIESLLEKGYLKPLP